MWLSGTEEDAETNCVVATAQGVPVGESEHPDWSADSKRVMRLPDRAMARVVGMVTEREWRTYPPEVALPEEVMDGCVAPLCRGGKR